MVLKCMKPPCKLRCLKFSFIISYQHNTVRKNKKILPKFVSHGVTNVKLLKSSLCKFVTEKYSQDPVKPLLSDQAYYPFDKDILNVIHSALGCGQYSKFDQVSWKDWLTHG